MKQFLSIAILGLGSTLLISSCNNSTTKTEEAETSIPVEKKQMGDGTSGIAMAFYYQDSIATQFGFYKEIDSIMRVKEKNFQSELESKYRAYQAYEADIQRKMENNEITGYQIEEIQQTAMQKQQTIQQFEQQRGAALQKESMEYQTNLMSKIAEAGKEFANKKEIDLLFFYQKGGQITFINNAFDVTDEFIAFLNKREDDLMSGVINDDSTESETDEK
ncbi:OmpH family outer membrane protein [Brumimicrobium mesophilum]|uniref:OmpH family outer membrane protein n=1 Tax=Brumimicrobium mesophilum TaxID=392717 RepID=UPI000D1418C9|nr:OmpH family outer membrane protein [Brumimicrobium mesophilum]